MSALPVTTASQGPRRVITQEQLQKLVRLRRLIALHATLRRRLLGLLDRGAATEPGPLQVEVRSAWHRRLTVKSLTPLLGRREAARLRDAVEPTEHRQLIVKGRVSGNGRER